MTSFLELVPTAIQRQATQAPGPVSRCKPIRTTENVGTVAEKRIGARGELAFRQRSAKLRTVPGQIARQITGGDENARLGFEVQGVLNKNSDVRCLYSFTAMGRTTKWLDIDRTASDLDTVVELIAADGTILALSNDSYLEETSPSTNPLFSALSATPSILFARVHSSKFRQAPRVKPVTTTALIRKMLDSELFFPAKKNVASLYHIRVRSSNQFPGQPAATPALTNPASVGQGRSRGSYQLQVRLSETQELPGSSISYADIRFATTGITLSGVRDTRLSSAKTAEVETRTFPITCSQNAQDLGNILATDRKTISLAGSLTSATDVDWYTFNIDYQQLVTPLAEYLSTIFDIDYADGIGRADMSMYLFTAQGNLIMSARTATSSTTVQRR